MNFTTKLIRELTNVAIPANALAMQTYMKYKFVFYGVKAPQRQEILKNLVKEYKPQLDRTTLIQICKDCYAQPQRELHYCGMELINRFLKKKFQKEDIDFITFLITTHSWWDTVDMICKHHLGNYLKSYPEQKPEVIKAYSNSGKLWLQPIVILVNYGCNALLYYFNWSTKKKQIKIYFSLSVKSIKTLKNSL